VLLWRGLAGLLAVVLLFPAWAGIAWAMLVFAIAADGPRPGAPDGDPCCASADTWGDVAFGLAWGLVLAAISITMIYATITLTGFAVTGARPKLGRPRRLLASIAAVVAAFGAYWAVLEVLY
jgi:hypothetical protein